MRSYFLSLALVVVLLVSLGVMAKGQTSSGGSSAASQPETVTSGGYVIHQSIEAGYRFTDQTGSSSMYDTLVNLQQGPRILEQTLSMQSETHESLLFDDLFVNSFGWGGDPNNVFRARLSKNKWYDFRGSFRRDQNVSDYNLLANPLNSSTSAPTVQVINSPHEFLTSRRISDVDLTLLPQSRLSFRLGYSHNNMSGPSFSSVHEGTDALLYQPWNTTLNSFRIGADWKLLPRTVLSFDQFLDYYKGDTTWQLGTAVPALMPDGTKTVELGLPFNTVASQPCAAGSAGLIDPAGVLTNVACNGYFGYLRDQRTRTSTPTERLSLRSGYFRWLDLTASYSYSSADLNTPNDEFFSGLISRTRQRSFLQTGPASAARIANTADFGAVIHVTSRFRIVDTFRYDVFRSPGNWNLLTTSLFGATLASRANIFSPATCPPPFTAATCPQHNSSSPADISVDLRNGFLKQDQRSNTFELHYDLTRKITGHIGYRYERRRIVDNNSDLQLLAFLPSLPNRGACAGLPLTNGVCTTTLADSATNLLAIDGYGVVAGLSARPTRALRLVFDTELFYADKTVTRMSPRQQSRYRVQATYTPRPWAVVGTSVNVLENSNEDLLTKARGHNRNYGFTALLAPRERFGLDLAYNYNDYLQNALICFSDALPTGVTLPVVTSAVACVPDPNNPLLTNSFYVSRTHFGSATVMFKPVKRVTTQLGYSISSVGGDAPMFNILQPDPSLHYNYHQPVANILLDMGHNLAWNAGWNYYQYNEKSFVGPTSPRYFHAQTATVSLRYAF
jgi:hypothetical protein